MITQKIYLTHYDWTIHCFYAVDCYYTREIVDLLAQLGCPPNALVRARDNMDSCRLNQGLTWSNPYLRTTVMVTSLTSSAAEFFDSLVHELDHVKCQISSALVIPTGSEEQAYLIGDLSRDIYPCVRGLLCDHCRKK